MKAIAIIMVLILAAAIAGCEMLPSTGDNNGGGSTGKAFKATGSSGIVVSFDPDKPPRTASVNEPIELVLNVKNRGTEDLGSGSIKVKLKGTAATQSFNPSSKESSNSDTIAAVDEFGYVSEGKIDMGTITYSPQEMVAASYTPAIEADICFPFVTKATTNNFYIGSKSADVSKTSSSLDNSDAPVQAGSLAAEPHSGLGELQFTFLVSNVGKGKAVLNCEGESTEKSTVAPKAEEEKVTVEIIEPSGASCKNAGEVTLIGGKKKIECSVPISKDEEAYQTQLLIRLSYNYKKEISTKVTIEK